MQPALQQLLWGSVCRLALPVLLKPGLQDSRSPDTTARAKSVPAAIKSLNHSLPQSRQQAGSHLDNLICPQSFQGGKCLGAGRWGC